tara:strand:+ start:426 stop:1193 length:768 start_codon:yes stop_codon:yes gene_type:complete
MSFDEIQLLEWQEAIEEACLNLNGIVKHCGRNSFAHIRKAWTIRKVDPEMAVFRAITAEEEAATAIIHALKVKQYEDSKLLNQRNHNHKSGIWYYIMSVNNALAETNIPTPEVRLQKKPPRIDLFLELSDSPLSLEQKMHATLDNPLNFSMKIDSKERHKAFQEQFDTFAATQGHLSIQKFIEAEANMRNKLLYASEGGIPSAEFKEVFLEGRLKRVTVLMSIALIIMQTSQKQLFIQQCLNDYIEALRQNERLT